MDLVWKNGFKHGGHNKVVIEIAYIPHAKVLKVLEGKQWDMKTPIEWNQKNNWPYNKIK
jgi:hypothetical protein